MVTNFGFETLPDKRIMVYHHGEYFYGNLPPISLVVSLIFRMHAKFVIKSTEHHLKYYAFRNDTEVDEKMEHDSREGMPIFWLKNYNWFKVLGFLLFDRELDMPNHLKQKRAEAMAIYKAENPDEDDAEEEEEEEEEDEEVAAATLARRKTIADAALSKKHTLPVQRPEIMRRITMDIAMDKAHAKETLGAQEDKDEEDEAFDAVVASKPSEVSPEARAQRRATLRRIATNTALKRFQTSLNRSPAATNDTVKAGLKRHSTKTMRDLSVDVDVDSTDNFKAVGLAARAKQVQRRATKMARRKTSLVSADELNKAMSFDIKKDKLDNA